MTRSFDVIVVGGGPVGAATARELALAGRRVLLLEAGGELGQAWKAAAGMLAPQIEAGPEDPLLELGLEARELYPTLAGRAAGDDRRRHRTLAGGYRRRRGH